MQIFSLQIFIESIFQLPLFYFTVSIRLEAAYWPVSSVTESAENKFFCITYFFNVAYNFISFMKMFSRLIFYRDQTTTKKTHGRLDSF